jgi:sporulation protein YlmC with PRC-barrel domain
MMIKRFRRSAILLSLALALMACQLASLAGKQATRPAGAATSQPTGGAIAGPGKAIPTDKISQTEQAAPTAKQAAATGQPDAAAWAKPVQSQAAVIQPVEMRSTLTHLTHWIGYQVVDEKGSPLGIASDFIINTCETYLVYILMEPDASLKMAPGSRVVIPFEAVTINSGVLDAAKKTIQLRLIPGQFQGAPVLPTGHELTPTDWEGAVRDFWMKAVRVGMLSTGCGVNHPLYKVAYATQLLGVKLYDGEKSLLGSVQEIILEPESGKIGFYIVKPAKDDGLVLVSLAVTNIPNEALLPGSALTLVFLLQPALFWDAPRIATAGEADDFTVQGKMRQYWGK